MRQARNEAHAGKGVKGLWGTGWAKALLRGLLLAALALGLAAPASAVQVCSLNITFTNTGAASYTYTFSTNDYNNCDPGGMGGIYTDLFGSTSAMPTPHGTIATDLNTNGVDKIVYSPSPVSYTGTDSALLYDANGDIISVTITLVASASPPGAPTIGTATAGNTQASVSFTAPGANGGSAITGYTVTATPGGLTGTGAASPITVSGLTNGTAYTFRVTATNANGTGSASAASNSVTPSAPQTLTFPNPGSQNFGTTPTLSATATSGLTPSFSSATTGVCTITSGGALTPVTAGTCTINANQAGNAAYQAAPQVQQSFTVAAVVPGAPTVGTATAGPGQATLTFTAPASNGGASITGYTVTSNPAGITGSGAASPLTVTGLTNGTTYTFTVTATNSAGTGSASTASNAVTPKAAQTLTFTNPGAQNFGTTPTLTATASSSLTPTFTSTTSGVCTITAGGALSFVTAGTCSIDADQAGNGSFLAAATVSRSFTVNPVAPGAPTVGTATAGNTQASVSFTAPASNGGATITGYTVTASPGGFTGSGAASPLTVTGLTNGTAYTFTVTATNSAATGGASAASNAVTPKAAQTLTFNNPGAQNFGTSPSLSASSTSGLTVSFTSSTSGVCTITSGGVLSFVASGTCTIDADQPGNAGYLAASTVSRSFTVNAVVPGAPTIGTATAGSTQASVSFTAPASNGGAVITGYTVTSSPGGLTGTGAASPVTVTGLTNGVAYTFAITATNATGTGGSSAASSAVTPKASQTITFSNPGAQNFGTTPSLTATASSSLPPSFTATTPGVCAVTVGGALTFITGGSCTINADQAGNGSFLAASTVSQSFTVNAVAPGAPTIGTATAGIGQATVAFTAPASSGGAAITGYTVTSSPGGLTGTGAASPVTVAGLTLGMTYTFTVTATNSAATGGASAASNAVTLQAAQTINFANPGAQSFGTSPTLTATATSGLAVSFTASTPGVCAITTGGALSFVAVGTCTIQADQAGNGSYQSAPPVSRSFTVNAPSLTIAPVALPAPVAGGAYRQTITMAGGVAPYGFSVVAGALPAGVSLNASSGVLSGTPTAAGTFSFSVRVTEGNGFSATQAYALAIAAPTLAVAPAGLAGGQQGSAYSQAVTASGGTAPYAFSVSAGSLPPGLSLNATSGQITGTPTANGSFSFTLKATDSTTGGTPGSGAQAYTLVVALGQPSAGATSAAVGYGMATTIPLAPAISGGAPTRVSVASPPAHGTAVVSGGTSVLYTPAAGYAGPDSFSYTASNGAGTSGAAAVSITVGAPALSYAPANPAAGTGGVAYSQSVAGASGGAAPYTYALASGALPAGLSLAANGSLAGTPTSGGSFQFTVTATDSSAGAGPFRVTSAPLTLTIGAATLTVAPATLPQPQVGKPYSAALSATGGNPPYRFALAAGSLPPGLSLDASSGALAGTPTAAGDFSFTLQASDSTSGATATGSRSYAVTTSPALPVAAALNVTTAFDTATTVDLTSAISGGAATSLAVVSGPAHGSATVSGLSVRYTPAAGFTGTDTLRYTASNVSGSSLPATLTIVVTPPLPVPVTTQVTVPNSGATGGGSQPVVIPLTIQGGPVSTVTITTPPRHGTVVITGVRPQAAVRALAAAGRQDAPVDTPAVTYTPNTGFVGSDSFSYTASNAAGTSAAATVTIQVTPPPPALAQPVLTASTKSGQPVVLAVADTATGGPFTGLSVVTAPAEGTVVVKGMTLVYTPPATFTGVATMAYALSNAYGSTPGKVSVTVTGRLDPSKDAEVGGLLAAQSDASRRFARAQLGNFGRRLESLHANDGWGRSGMALGLSSFGVQSRADALQDQLSQLYANRAIAATPLAHRPAADAGAAPRQRLAKAGEAGEAGGPQNREPLALWVGGGIDFGRRDAVTGQERLRFHTDGISLGADYRVSDRWSVGVGGGFGSDRTDIGMHGSRSTARNSALAVYAALRPAEHVFVDGVLGYSQLNFDLNRFITDAGGFATGSRSGRQWFGSLSGSYETRSAGGWLLAPYGGLELMRSTLAGYTEAAADVNALSYADQRLRMGAAKLGLRVEFARALGTGELQPRLRVELRHQFEGTSTADMGYADLGAAGQIYQLQPPQDRRSHGLAEIGARWVLPGRGMAVSLDYGTQFSNGSGSQQSLRLAVEGRF